MWSEGLRITEGQTKALQDLMKFSLMRASRELGSFSGMPFGASEPHLENTRLTKLPANMGADESLSVGVLMQLEGEVEGLSLVIFSWGDARTLWEQTVGHSPDQPDWVFEKHAEAINDAALAAATGFWDAMGEVLRLEVRPTDPMLCIDMHATLISALATEAGMEDQFALVMHNTFGSTKPAARCQMISIPTVKSLSGMLTHTGVTEAA